MLKNFMPEDMPELEYDFESEREWLDSVIDMLGDENE